MDNENVDVFVPFLGQITKVYTQGHVKPLFGRLVEISNRFLTFERRDGRRVLVMRSAILTIEQAPAQLKEAV